MGYTTEFRGEFTFNTPLKPKMKKYLELFNQTRRVGRDIEKGYGTEGEFHVFENDNRGVIDYNTPPKTQPGLWCKWTPNADGTALEWDTQEKFYNYSEWLVYMINKILAPNGYILNGTVEYRGEELRDKRYITVVNNVVFVDTVEIKPEKVECSHYISGEYKKNGIELDVILILMEDGKELDGGIKSLTA